MTVRIYAERKGWPLSGVKVQARHVKRADAAGDLLDRFERVLELSGPLTPDRRHRLVEIADRCPVSQTLQRGSDVTASE